MLEFLGRIWSLSSCKVTLVPCLACPPVFWRSITILFQKAATGCSPPAPHPWPEQGWGAGGHSWASDSETGPLLLLLAAAKLAQVTSYHGSGSWRCPIGPGCHSGTGSPASLHHLKSVTSHISYLHSKTFPGKRNLSLTLNCRVF